MPLDSRSYDVATLAPESQPSPRTLNYHDATMHYTLYDNALAQAQNAHSKAIDRITLLVLAGGYIDFMAYLFAYNMAGWGL